MTHRLRLISDWPLACSIAALLPAVALAATDPAPDAAAVAPTLAACPHDRDALLALDEQAFDQDLADGGGGWRAVAKRPGCDEVAADLIAAYRERHPGGSPLLAWHEGQMRASSGQYERAIPTLEMGRWPDGRDLAGFNLYVDATVAFLRGDRAALLAARERLPPFPYPADAGLPPLQDGFMVFPAKEGQPPMRMRWPMNLDVVDGLVACFGKPYAEAYGAACRPPKS